MVHKQKFNDPLSSTGQISLDMRVLELESEVSQSPRFNWIFLFLCSEASDANIGIIANVVCL